MNDDKVAAGTLQKIPSVTEHDLELFSTTHFSAGPSLAFYSAFLPAQPSDEHSAGPEDTIDEGLGCYADGVRRTLSNEQIEMFRHSEVHSILRQRQLEAEAQAADESDEEGEISDSPEVNRKDVERLQDDVDEREYTEFLLNEKEQFRADKDSRAHIRTLDEETATTAALNYGDEVKACASTANDPLGRRPGRKVVSYDDELAGHEPEQIQEPKKFIWPRIG